MRFCKVLMVFTASLWLAGCGTLSTWDVETAKVGGESTDGTLREEVDSIAGPAVQGGSTPGLVVGLLLPDGRERYFGYGTTDASGGQTPNADTLFAVGSLSKGFLAAVASSLVHEGRLSWSDTLGGLLPTEIVLSADSAKISLEQLATHTSGLPRQPGTLRTLFYFVQYLYTGDNFYRHLNRDNLLAYLADFSAPSAIEPQYSNIGYGILGYAIEQRTGRSLDDLLAERITGPLGLTHTGYDPERLPGYAERAIGHAGDQPKFIRRGSPVPDWHMTEIMRGSAALYSSARDLLRFGQAHVRAGAAGGLYPALSDNLRIRFPRPREAAAVAWIADDVKGVHIVYQVGIIAGYTSYLAVNEANGSAVVVLQNAFNWDYSVGHRLMLLLASGRHWSD